MEGWYWGAWEVTANRRRGLDQPDDDVVPRQCYGQVTFLFSVSLYHLQSCLFMYFSFVSTDIVQFDTSIINIAPSSRVGPFFLLFGSPFTHDLIYRLPFIYIKLADEEDWEVGTDGGSVWATGAGHLPRLYTLIVGA